MKEAYTFQEAYKKTGCTPSDQRGLILGGHILGLIDFPGLIPHEAFPVLRARARFRRTQKLRRSLEKKGVIVSNSAIRRVEK